MCAITPKLLKSSIDLHKNESFAGPKSVLMVYYWLQFDINKLQAICNLWRQDQ